MTVNRRALFTLGAAGLLLTGFMGATAWAQNAGRDMRGVARPSVQLAQKAARPARARTRIRVTRVPPVYPYRLESSVYPVPYTYEYPGPNAVRQCTAWLATEHRLSGTVVVPRTQCWWERP